MNKKNGRDSKKGIFGPINTVKPDSLPEELDSKVKPNPKKPKKKINNTGNSDRFKEYRKKLRDSVEKGKDSAIEEANNSFRVLNHFLIIIATTIFSFSLLVLNNREFAINLESIRLRMVFWVWVVLGFSIISGVMQFFIEYNFFKKWVNTCNNVLNRLNDFKENHSNEEMLYNMVIKEQKDMKTESNHFCIYLQVFLISLSFFLLIISIYQIIFKLVR